MEQDDGFGGWVLGVAEVVDVAVGAQAGDDGGARRGVQGLPLGTHWDFSIVADAHEGALAPDKGPPWADGHGAQDGALFLQCWLSCGVRGCPQFAVGFVLIGVGEEVADQRGADAVVELKFLMARKMAGSAVLRFETAPAKRQAITVVMVRPAVGQASSGDQVARPQSLILC